MTFAASALGLHEKTLMDKSTRNDNGDVKNVDNI